MLDLQYWHSCVWLRDWAYHAWQLEWFEAPDVLHCCRFDSMFKFILLATVKDDGKRFTGLDFTSCFIDLLDCLTFLILCFGKFWTFLMFYFLYLKWFLIVGRVRMSWDAILLSLDLLETFDLIFQLSSHCFAVALEHYFVILWANHTVSRLERTPLAPTLRLIFNC